MSAPGAGLSIREFATRDGCNEKLVRRALHKGRLTALSDGKLDPSLVGTDWRRSARQGADTGADIADNPVSAPAESVRTTLDPQPHGGALKRTLQDAAETGGFEGADEFIQMVLAGQFMRTSRAEAVKENALALKHLLDARQRAGSLVDLETAEAVLFETSRAARDSWLNWPIRIGPLLAADLGLDAERVTEALTPYVQKQLEDLGEPDADFTSQPD